MASLETDELAELHSRIKRAMADMKAPKDVEIHSEYSKLLDQICHKYNFKQEKPVRDDFDDTSSIRTIPTVRSRAPTRSNIKPNRSKSSDICKSSFSIKRKRMQSR